MSPLDDPLHRSDDERFDLLADGELPEAERRELLSSLDRLPDGWRRCALAFLEAQSWKDGMRSIQRESTGRPAQVRPIRRSRFPGGLLGTLVAMAACFLAALGVGPVLHSLWRPNPEPGRPPEQFAQISEQAPAQPAEFGPPGPSSVSPSGPANWELVTLPVGLGPGGATSISLPALETDRIDDEWLERFAPKIPPDLLRVLEQSGHEVRRTRRLVPFRLDDGRQVVVPFEEVEFRPAGGAAYQ